MDNYFVLLNEGELWRQQAENGRNVHPLHATTSNSRVTHFNIAETCFSINIRSKFQANKNSTYLHFLWRAGAVLINAEYKSDASNLESQQ
jgi:hypothetical protein